MLQANPVLEAKPCLQRYSTALNAAGPALLLQVQMRRRRHGPFRQQGRGGLKGLFR